MMNKRTKGGAGICKRALVVAMALSASLLTLIVAPPAMATPKGEFAPFAQCPLSNTELTACIVASTSSGEFIVGKRTVPIKNTITLQGGFIEKRGVVTFVGAANGETLSKTPQTVPGGLFGIEGLGGEVTATTELAGSASSIVLNERNLLTEEGTALSLPVKVKLGNPFLGENCYIGSNEHPIILNLTTGTTSPPKPNEPIKGKAGTQESNKEGTILTINNNSLVNNSFAAPGVQGCGVIPFLVDPLVNLLLGVPAGEGHNTVILNGSLKQAAAAIVREHE